LGLKGAKVAARYKAVYRNGELFAEYVNGELSYLAPSYSPAKRSDLPTPYVIKDIGEYWSPLDGTTITSRSQHREHMRAHDVVEVGNERIGNMTAATERAAPAVDRDLGETIKRRIDEVATLPQKAYDAQVEVQQAEHAEVAALVTAA
jgi:hypothetical protein